MLQGFHSNKKVQKPCIRRSKLIWAQTYGQPHLIFIINIIIVYIIKMVHFKDPHPSVSLNFGFASLVIIYVPVFELSLFYSIFIFIFNSVIQRCVVFFNYLLTHTITGKPKETVTKTTHKTYIHVVKIVHRISTYRF